MVFTTSTLYDRAAYAALQEDEEEGIRVPARTSCGDIGFTSV